MHIPFYWNPSAIASTQRTFDCPSLAIDKQKPIILQKWHWSSLSIVIGIVGIYSRWRYCNRPKLSRFNRLSDLSICTIPYSIHTSGWSVFCHLSLGIHLILRWSLSLNWNLFQWWSHIWIAKIIICSSNEKK